MCMFESSQTDESRVQSADSSKACRKYTAFNCTIACDVPESNLSSQESIRVRVESQELFIHFKSLVLQVQGNVESQLKFAILPVFFGYKLVPINYKMVPDEPQTGAQCCFSTFYQAT